MSVPRGRTLCVAHALIHTLQGHVLLYAVYPPDPIHSTAKALASVPGLFWDLKTLV